MKFGSRESGPSNSEALPWVGEGRVTSRWTDRRDWPFDYLAGSGTILLKPVETKGIDEVKTGPWCPDIEDEHPALERYGAVPKDHVQGTASQSPTKACSIRSRQDGISTTPLLEGPR